MRVFLDANILFSASFPKSRLAVFLHDLKDHAVLLTSAYAKAEAARNITEKLPHNLARFETLALSLEQTPASLFDLHVELVEKDRPILCSAVSGKADFLLTGDKKDFGPLLGKTVMDVRIVNVELLIDELLARKILHKP
jgi:predicted nucleic acid-binding protein